MTKNYGWGVLLLSLGAIVLGTSSASVAADMAKLTGQCRAAKQSTGLYKDRDSSSALLSSLKLNDKVTLAEETARDSMILVRDRKSTRLNSSHITPSRMPSSA